AEADVERVWLAEADRRLEEMRKGKVKGVDAASAFKKAHEAFKR
ncbi:MAG: addiction module protein, partial [Deltaproteobacteria bacterium]